MSEDFHWTFALVLCQTVFHDCEDTSRRKEFVVLVGIVRKPAQYVTIPFATAADEFRDDSEDSPTLILVPAPSALEVIPGSILRPVPSTFYSHA